MAAGLGYIEFTTGDILTAAAANGYLASQVVMVFADATARTAAIASPQQGMVSFLKGTNSTEYYSGSAWVAIGGGSTSGPSFGVYRATNQSVIGSTYTKVQLNTEEWDTDNCFDSTTNYRFTPNKAGYYQINFTCADSGSDFYGRVYKNGSNFKTLWGAGVSGATLEGSCMVYANGTTDYFEFYIAHFGGTADIYGGQASTYASAAWIRG